MGEICATGSTRAIHLDLPTELWVTIFARSIGDPFPGHRGLSSPIQLASVCRHWREIFLANSPLWSIVCIQFSTDKLDQQVELLKCWMSRACEHPISVKLAFVGSTKGSYHLSFDFSSEKALEIPATIGCHASQIKSLDSMFSIYWQDLLGGVHFPILSKLILRHYPPSETDIMSLIPDYETMPMGERFPALSEVELENGIADLAVALPWNQITKIKLNSLTASDCLSILLSKPKIQHAFFDTVLGDIESETFTYEPPFGGPPLPSQAISNLTHLSITGSSNAPFGVAQTLSALQNCQNLLSLSLHSFRIKPATFWAYEYYFPAYNSFLLKTLPNFTSLRHLSIIETIYDETALLDLLSFLPGLQALEVATSRIVVTSESLLRIGSGALLPCLFSLSLSGKLEWQDAELVSFFRSRCRAPTNTDTGAGGLGTNGSGTPCVLTRLKVQYTNEKVLSDELYAECRSLLRQGVQLSVLLKNVIIL